MIFKLLSRLFWVLVIAIVIYVGWQTVRRYFQVQSSTPQENSQTPVEVKPLQALIVQQGADKTKRILSCQAICSPQAIPHSLNSDALTDGQAWYYYQEPEDSNKVALIRSPVGTQTQKVIAQETDLIKPRGIYINPAGTKIVYFLDNIHEPEKYLTEIWVYDTASDAVSVVAQNIYSPDIISKVRWNAAGNIIWLIADSGEEDESRIELIVANLDSRQAKAQFTTINWQQLTDIADHGPMDISQAGDQIAYAKRGFGPFDKLVVVQENGQQQAATVTGTIPYVEWLPDNSLAYAVQDSLGFTFWQAKGDKAQSLGVSRGVLRSARADDIGQYILFAADTGREETALSVLQLASGLIKEQVAIPPLGANSQKAQDQVFVVRVQQASDATPVASITSQLADDELAAFIDNHLGEITGDEDAKKIRLVITDKPNTIYLDYKAVNGDQTRLLVTIQDAVNPEWSTLARYKPQNGDWQKIQGGAATDPKAIRLYEWEESLNKWVLKQEINP